MRKPRITSLKIDQAETKRVRLAMAHQKSIKITININAETLTSIKALAESTGIPYQRLINRTLSESLAIKGRDSSRLDLLEKELAALKRKIAA